MSDDATRQTNFANMSAVLTGFTTDVINPLFDPLELVSTYLETADKNGGPQVVNALIQQFLTLSAGGTSKQQIANTLLDTGNADPGEQAKLARLIVMMWYLGSWYGFPTGGPQVVSQN